jgi:Na+-driven multidrug efflux pump
MAFNLLSNMIRALGDSRTPLLDDTHQTCGNLRDNCRIPSPSDPHVEIDNKHQIQNIIQQAQEFICVILGGMFASMAFNLLSNMIRALGPCGN